LEIGQITYVTQPVNEKRGGELDWHKK
jgi:hypothetical protein